VVHDLHDLARVDTRKVSQELEPEGRLIVERGQHLRDVARRDAHLGLVVALPDRPGQLVPEATLQPGLERAIHV
jgi:autonomous glycyl radical cofactor GrcA